MEHKDIGNFIAERRKAKGLTQKQLAEKLYVSDKAISKWERNICLFDISLIQPLADILDVSMNYWKESFLILNRMMKLFRKSNRFPKISESIGV